MKGTSLSVGFLLLTLGGSFLGGAVACDFETNDGLLCGIVSGVCLVVSMVSFWRAHRNGEDEISVYDYLENLQEDSEKE